MPDTPFKAMGREKRPTPLNTLADVFDAPMTVCEKCNGTVREGDWPFCRGNPSDHVRD